MGPLPIIPDRSGHCLLFMTMTDYLDSTYDYNDPGLIGSLDELPYWSAPFGISLLEKVRLKHGLVALDIGFGTGFPLTELAMRLGKTSLVYGIDIWKTAIARARQKIEQFEIDNIQILEADAAAIPLGDNGVDLIVSNNGINNVDNMDAVFGECSRVIRNEGQMVITQNLDATMIEFYSVLREELIKRQMTEALEALEQHIYSKRKPLDEVLRLLQKHGFEVTDLVHKQFDYRFVDGSTMFRHYFIRMAFLDSWKEIIDQHRRKEIFGVIEEQMNETAREQGCFLLSVPYVTIDCIKAR